MSRYTIALWAASSFLIGIGAISGCNEDANRGGSSGGSAVSTPANPRFSTLTLAELSGAEGYDWLGLSLTMAGDVNGDKVADVFVSALSASHGGRVGVFLGPITGSKIITEADALVNGEFQFNNAGQSIAEAGHCDVDGDGLNDLILGSPFADRFDIAVQAQLSGDNNGRAFVIFGGSGLAQSWAAANGRHTGHADVTFVGVAKYDTAGSTVACAGDLDGDGRDELAIAAPRGASAEGPGVGAVHLVYGRPRDQFPLVFNLEDSDATFRGEAAHDAAGTAIGRIGDVTGDGLPDLVISSPGHDENGQDAGAVYLVAGSPSRFGGNVPLSMSNAAFLGEFEGQRLGLSVTSAGDFNGDGIRDVLIGSSPVSTALSKPGRAYVLAGGKSLAGRTVVSVACLTLIGEKDGDSAGLGIASLGDVTGDGRSEIAIGAPAGDGIEARAGRVYAVKGQTFMAPATFDLRNAIAFAEGGTVTDHLGEVLGAGDDFNGDGVADVVVSARGHSTKISAAGSIYIVSGKGIWP